MRPTQQITDQFWSDTGTLTKDYTILEVLLDIRDLLTPPKLQDETKDI